MVTDDLTGLKKSVALDSIERLDLWNEHLGWQLHQLSKNDDQAPKELTAKGCYIMYNLKDFDFGKIRCKSTKMNRKHNIHNFEEEKEEVHID